MNLSQEKGMQKVKTVQSLMKDIEESFDIIFYDIPSNIGQIPNNTNEQVEQGLQMLDNTVSFLNEFQIEKDKMLKEMDKVNQIVKSMTYSLEEILDFYQLLEEYNQLATETQASSNPQIVSSKEKIQNVTKDFNQAVEVMEDQVEHLMEITTQQSNEVARISNAIPQEARVKDEKNKYSKERLKAMDLVVQELPSILNSKVEIDSSIQKINIQVVKINNLRKMIVDNFELIKLEQKKDPVVDKKDKNLLKPDSFQGRLNLVMVALLLF